MTPYQIDPRRHGRFRSKFGSQSRRILIGTRVRTRTWS